MTYIDDTPAPSHADAPHGHQVNLETGLAFINTLEYKKGEPFDDLDSPRTAIRWLFANDLLHRYMVKDELDRIVRDPAAADRMLGKIRKVRHAMRELADAAVERRPADK